VLVSIESLKRKREEKERIKAEREFLRKFEKQEKSEDHLQRKK